MTEYMQFHSALNAESTHIHTKINIKNSKKEKKRKKRKMHQ